MIKDNVKSAKDRRCSNQLTTDIYTHEIGATKEAKKLPTSRPTKRKPSGHREIGPRKHKDNVTPYV
jgi:hypothetical protein